MGLSGPDEDVEDTVSGKAIVKRYFSLKPFHV
jgi:hypothetical protein